MNDGQANATPVAQAPVPVKPGLPAKLTAEETQQRYAFIGMCVDRNITYPATRTFGQASPMTVQDLCAANVASLQKMASALKGAAANHDPEFSNTGELMINKVEAEKWLTFFRLTIRKKNWDAYAHDKRARAKDLHKSIEAALTPQEQRARAEAELAGLKDFDDDED